MDLSGVNTVELAHVKYEDISLVDNDVELENDNETLETEEEMINEDKKQQMKVLSLFVVEFYKILTGCLLLIFVPQKCGDHNCTINDIERSQDWPEVWEGSPALRLTKVSYFENEIKNEILNNNGKTYDPNNSLGFKISKIEGFDIDDEFDFRMAEAVSSIK